MSRHTGTFVYKGAGKKQSANASEADKVCSKLACNIQWCLAKRNHDQDKCKSFVEAWQKCVDMVNESEREKKEGK